MKSKSQFSLVVIIAATALLVLMPFKARALYDLYACCETDLLSCAPGCTDQADCPWNCWNDYLECEHLFPYQGGGPNPDCGAFTHYRLSGIILRHPANAQNFTISIQPTSYAFATNLAGVLNSVHLYVGNWNGTNSVGTTTATGVDFYAVPLSVVSAYAASNNLGALPWKLVGSGTQDGAGYWGMNWTPPSDEAYVVDADTYDPTLTNLFINNQGIVTNGGSSSLGLVLPTPATPKLITPTALPDGSFMLRVIGPPAAAFTLQSSADLKNWTNEPTVTNFNGLAQVVEGPSSTSSYRFYRASFTPLPAPLSYQGLVNAPLGNAAISTSGDSLYITNLSSSGQDGVSIAAPADLSGFDVQLQELDPSNSLPVGAFVKQTLIGTFNGIPNSILGTVTTTKTGATNVSVAADFSAIGASTYSVQSYYQGTLTAQASNQTGAAVEIAGGPCTNCYRDPFGTTYLYSTNSGQFLGEDWGFPVFASFSGSAFASMDYLYISPENVTNTVTVTAMQLTASQMPALTITSENASLLYQGLANTSLGNAAISASGSSLYITNLSSSGQDGVSITMPTNLSSYSVSWQELDPSGTLPIGAFLQEKGIGNAPGITNGVVFSTTSTKIGSGQYGVTASFNNSNVIDVAVYSAGSLVTTVTGLSGTLCVASDGGYDVDDTIKNQPKKTYPPNTTFAFNGLGSVQGDTLVLIPETSPQISAISSIQLLASRIPSIDIVDELASGPFTRLQVLLPGETNAPYTVTGKTGTPAPLTGGQVICTVLAVDSNWNPVPTVADTINITCSDPNSITPSPAPLVNGSGQFTVFFTDDGASVIDTISASDISNTGIAPGTSSQFNP